MNIDVNRLITGEGAARVRPGLRYYVGVDLGQKRDHTAVAVVERQEVVGTRRDPVTWALEKRTVYAVRYLERMPLDFWASNCLSPFNPLEISSSVRP